MSDRDELLQQKLRALENGAPLESLLAELPGEDEELVSLVHLAVAVRQLSHPKPALARLRARKYALVEMARSSLRGRSNGRLKSVLNGGRIKSVLGWLEERLDFQTPNPGRAVAPALIGVLLAGVITSMALIGTGVWLAGPPNAQVAALQEVSGAVRVTSLEEPGQWQAVSSGFKIQPGQRIQTGPDAHATLTFFEGSRSSLGANSDLTVTRVDGNWGNVLRVVLTQTAGRTSNDIVPFGNRASSFLVLTPSSTASVHGTDFSVAVDSYGKSRFEVEHGRVLVTNEKSEVFLSAGQVLTAGSRAELESPEYQFTLQGQINDISGDTWVIASVSIAVDEGTEVNGNPEQGNNVYVEGRVMEDGAWFADLIRQAETAEEVHTFTGLIESMGEAGQDWQIGGWQLIVDDDTQIDAGLIEGTPVRATFEVLEDGRWLALSIQMLEAPPQDLAPTETPDPEALPVLVFDAETMQSSGCEAEFEFQGSLKNEQSDPEDYAANIELASQPDSGAEFVDGIEISPAEWERIEAGESQEFEVKVRLNEEAWQNAPDGTLVALRVFIASESNNTEGHNSRLEITISKACQETEPPETTEAPTETTPEPESTPEVFTDCTGAQPHPTGTKLADRFKVTYEEIMGWFCQGFGFGEIDLAYELSRQHNVAVADIFALRSSGMGWGQIKKIVATLPTMTPTPSATPTATVTSTITATLTMTPTLTPTPEPSETPEPTDEENGQCTGAQPHPTGTKLAQHYGVSYEEIMGWFCQGFGFGEIDLAYSLSLQSGVPVDQIFAMKSSGMGWGQIKKEILQTKPEKGNPQKNKNKP